MAWRLRQDYVTYDGRDRRRRCAVVFHVSSGCGNLKAFSEDVKASVPQELSQRGVTLEMWSRWMRQNDQECVPHSSTRGWNILAVFLFSIAFIPGFLLTRFTKQRNFSKWQINTAAWLDRVNAELGPLGMYCRFRKQQLRGARELVTWLVFALDAEESAALEAEPTTPGLCYPSWTDDNVV